MKLRKSEWVAIAITAAFLLVVIGIRIGGANHSAPVTVRTEQPQASVLVTPAPDSAKPLPQDERINLNTATQKELEALYGIGATLAGRIVEYREENGPFTAVEDITRVPGIAEKVYQDNYTRMCVD